MIGNTVRTVALVFLVSGFATAASAAPISASRLKTLKAQAVAGVEARAKLSQVMNDQIFSYGELGFQEI